MTHQQLLPITSQAVSFASFADTLLGSVHDTIFKSSWLPFADLAESAVVSTFQQLDHGQLRVVKQDGRVHVFPPLIKNPGPTAELHVVRDAFWMRLACMGGLGFAEGYMLGDVKCGMEDLRNVFKIFLLNREKLDRIEGTLSKALSVIPNYFTSSRFTNALGITRSNISAHYDISNCMFEGFLSRDMMYSSAIFEELDGDLLDGDTGSHVLSTSPLADTRASSRDDSEELHEAQLRKIRHILRRLKIKPGSRILEIGTGWGEFAIRAVQSVPNCDCTVESITLSSEQKTLAEQRIAAAGLQDKIRVHLLDYRALPKEWEGTFDRFVSIEMIEHVGLKFLPTYFGVVNWALKRRDAVGVIQVSTMPDTRIEAYETNIDFIQKYIFPGCFLPTVTQLVDGIHKGSGARFIVDTVDNIGPHYSRTLREWARRFDACFDDVIAPELRIQYPDVMNGEGGAGELEIFRRKWLYYFYYCEAGFQSRTLGNHTISFLREATGSYGCNLESSTI